MVTWALPALAPRIHCNNNSGSHLISGQPDPRQQQRRRRLKQQLAGRLSLLTSAPVPLLLGPLAGPSKATPDDILERCGIDCDRRPAG